MTLELAEQLAAGDIVLYNGKEWEVADILRDEDRIMISARRDDTYEIFDYEEVSSKE